MPDLQQLIDKYLAAADDDARAEILRADFEWLDDAGKWAFLLPLLERNDTYDLAKISIYAIIETADLSGVDVIAMKDRLLAALEAEQDELVKQYGFTALTWNFATFPDVIDLCIKTVEDADEDENVRFCAFGVITKSKDHATVASLRQRLLDVSDFAKYATTFFAERDKGLR